MNQTRRKWTMLLCAAAMTTGLLAACSNGDGGASAGASGTAAPSLAAPSAPAATQSAPEASSSGAAPSGSSAAAPTASPSAQPSELPATRDFTLSLEGNEEVRTAKLAEGDGYALYVFDIFSFDATAGRLTMDVDKNYYVDVQKLPDGYKLDDIRSDAEKELAATGKVNTVAAGDISPQLGGAELMLVAAGDKLTREIIVRNVDGAGYLFKVNKPQGEPSEGFDSHAFATIGSLVGR